MIYIVFYSELLIFKMLYHIYILMFDNFCWLNQVNPFRIIMTSIKIPMNMSLNLPW